MHSGINSGSLDFAVAVIDGPYDASVLSEVLESAPVSLAYGSCDLRPNEACDHGTFILGLLGARHDAMIPGMCPDCRLMHIPLFADASSPSASVDELAAAIAQAVSAGARLINLSLAILGDESRINRRLAAALDFAEASGSVLVVAAGNHGRLAAGQLLAHPAVIPVVAADASQRPLQESNFGPAISSRGIAALGRMPGYSPGGGMTVMSGTSVAAAVATGILAQEWSAHPDIDGTTLRSVVAGLGPRGGLMPPMLDRGAISAALNHAAPMALVAATAGKMPSHARLQGATTMINEDGRQATVRAAAGLKARPPQTVTPAGCGCGAPEGVCTCHEEATGLSGFVYAIGTIEAEYPNMAIEWEMQALAEHLNVDFQPEGNIRSRLTEHPGWQHAVLSTNKKLTRYVARQLRWRLTVEDLPVFVISPSDPSYFDDLIDALVRPVASPEPRRRPFRAARPEPVVGTVEDLDVVVGVAGPRTSEGITVLADHIFQLNRSQLAPDGLSCFSQLADNDGLTDEDRAFNFLAARYTPSLSPINGFHFSGMRVSPSRLSSEGNRIVRAIYTFRNDADAKKEYFVRVDVTNEFPMITSPWQQYVERGGRS